jgi:hypothetical protein
MTSPCSTLAAVLVLSTGCTSARQAVAPAEEDAPFYCEPEVPKVEPQPVPAVALPTGKLDLACQPEAPLAAPKPEDGEAVDGRPSEHQRFLARRCRFVAQAVPLVEVAIALSQATGHRVSVPPELMALRVGVSMPEATVEQFIHALASQSGQVKVWDSGGTARFEWRGAGTNDGCLEEVLVVLHPIPAGVPGRQLASTVCRHTLSSRGSVSLLGRQLVVSDVRANQERLRALLRALDPKAPAPGGR